MNTPPTRLTPTAAATVLDDGLGIVRLAPNWVPRVFCTPGQRLRLHPDDHYAYGKDRGGIDERWLASPIRADNGPATGEHEGVSLVVAEDGTLFRFDELIAHHGAALVGQRIWNEHGKWPVFAKLFDNQQALPFHVHHRDEHAHPLGKVAKPEAYYYPPQLNNHLAAQPVSFLGLQPQVTREQLAERLEWFARGGDNRITELSLGYRTRLGTGWDIPAGVLHAPGSVCTYEPQLASDVLCMCESWSNNREVPDELLWKDVPADRVGDLNYIIELLDWQANVDPDFVTNRQLIPFPTQASLEAGGEAFSEKWIVYKSPHFSAKELTVLPGASAVIVDTDAYGVLVVQGHGSLGLHHVAAAGMLRFGELSDDEFFVSAAAARTGVRVHNRSLTEPLVLLKHFGPGNAELAEAVGPFSTDR
ncbi:MAG: hypothetical protein CVT62_09050 [Actinobacteria bacterium HGW-Actinobacteria-2]|nr:MAG: hypothetical protein CVT62_09050 [Actinobacteria bacterium HGW-Actinobacteria-2]